MKRIGTCLRGESCPYAHNVFEYWLHPTRWVKRHGLAWPGRLASRLAGHWPTWGLALGQLGARAGCAGSWKLEDDRAPRTASAKKRF